ncbi:hypothetical protein [Nonomuraea basaltis]|nr:hypothetical protein [Nonomuraea basaltis]
MPGSEAASRSMTLTTAIDASRIGLPETFSTIVPRGASAGAGFTSR